MDTSLKAALKEAYLYAEDAPVILSTLEFRHPSFLDDLNGQTALRFVADHEDIQARLEVTAPLNAGQYVTFIGAAFEIELYGSNNETVAPEITIKIDNVGRELIRHIDAIDTIEPIAITYRAYLANDLSQPQHDPTLDMEITTIEWDAMTVTAHASIAQTLAGKSFPNRVSTAREFPGLIT